MNKLIKLSIISLLVLNVQCTQASEKNSKKRSATQAQLTGERNVDTQKINLDTPEDLEKALDAADIFYTNYVPMQKRPNSPQPRPIRDYSLIPLEPLETDDPTDNSEKSVYKDENITIVQSISDWNGTLRQPLTATTFQSAGQSTMNLVSVCDGKIVRLARLSATHPVRVEITKENKKEFLKEVAIQLDRCGIQLCRGSESRSVYLIFKK